jgi:hypothetical protein
VGVFVCLFFFFFFFLESIVVAPTVNLEEAKDQG